LCTHPDFERKGLARALVEPMLDVSKAEGIPVWVESSPKGRGFYGKLDFKLIEILEVDLSLGNKGLTGTHPLGCMKWTPKDQKEVEKKRADVVG
jgi:GNAT superfamily N-acetyltransferase